MPKYRIQSMTGFGRAEMMSESCRITAEIKSVNHRYLDISIRMPKQLNSFESSIRSLLKEYMERGKIEVFLSYEDFGDGEAAVRYNEKLAEEYFQHLKRMQEHFGLRNELSAYQLSRYPDVFTMEERNPDEHEIWDEVSKVLREACLRFTTARYQEGELLTGDILEKLSAMMEYVDYIDKEYPAILVAYRERLENKVKELLMDTQMEESRIAAEVTIYSDKICVDEETVRLRSHIHAAKDTLTMGGSVGRKLDFIVQEMNREANTILSKAGSLAISDAGIQLKTVIEKIREQIQNIE